MKAFRASAAGCGITAPTPRAAAELFFVSFPNKRKCDVIEGEIDGAFFTVKYNKDAWPRSWKDITKKGAAALPDTADC